MPAVGEVAELQVLLTLRDQLSGGITAAQTKIAELSGVAGLGGLSGVAAKAETAIGKVGTALGTAAGKIKGIIAGPLGLIGLSAAAFGVAGALEKGITEANTMALTIEKLTGETGASATAMSIWSGVLSHFNIDAATQVTLTGLMEKNLGNLTATTKKATDFQDKFGFSLLNSNGTVKDANTLLSTFADYFNNSAIPAQTKAAAAAALFGRSWQQIIPVLQAGSSGIASVTAELKANGLVLDEQNISSLKDYQASVRDLGTAMDGLELQIGLALVPALTTLAHNLTSFIHDNRTNIVGFFQGAAKFAGDLAGVVTKDVVPAISAIVGWWNALPGPLKDLLIAGFVTGKVTKFLFDTNIPAKLLGIGVTWAAQFVAGIGKDILGMAAGGAVAAGEIEAGMAAGGATAAAEIGGAGAGTGALGGIGALGTGGIAAAGAGLAAIAIAFTGGLHTIESAISGFFGGGNLNYYQGQGSPFTGSASQYGVGQVSKPSGIPGLGNARGEHAGMSRAENEADKLGSALQTARGWLGSWTSALQKAEQAANKQFNAGKNVGAAADTITSYFTSLSSAYFDPSKTGVGNLTKEILRFHSESVSEAKHGNTTLATKLQADADKLQGIKDKLATADGTLSGILKKPSSFVANTYVTVRTDVSTRDIQTAEAKVKATGRPVAI